MCIFKNQEKIKQDNIFSIMTKSLDISRLFGQSSFIFLKNISGLISNRLGLTTSDLFSIEPDQHKEEINRFLGKFRACNRSNQLLLLDTLDFLAEQLLARQNEKHKDMG